MSDYRIIDPPGLAGTRTLLVDGQGNADYNTIQAAIDAAAAVATANERWQVRVAPGVYAENVVMADYVDLVGLAPGRAALIKPASGVALVGNVDATLANLMLASTNDAVIETEARVTSPEWHLYNIIIDQTVQYHNIRHGGGKLHLWGCLIAGGGPIELEAAGSYLYAYHSVMRNKATSGSGHKVILVTHGSMWLYGCLVENTASAGYGIYIANTPGTLKALHTTIRRANSTYSVTADLSCNFYMNGCVANAAIDSNVSGANDVVVDGGA